MKKIRFLYPNWKVIFTMAVFLFAASTAFAQDEGGELAETLEKLSESAARSYIAPLVSAFGSNLNSGWFHRAPAPKKFGFNLEFGIVGMATFLPDDPEFRSFTTSGDFRFDRVQAQTLFDTTGLSSAQLNDLVDYITGRDFTVSISGATIIGDSTNNIEVQISGEPITVPDPDNPGSDLNITLDGSTTLPVAGLGALAENAIMPFAAPQASVGTILGTKATFRYVPEIEVPLIDITEDIGKFSWFGWGVQHNPGVFFSNPLPVDISLCYYSQNLKLGDIFEAKATAWGLTASKKLSIPFLSITPYVGFLIEKSSIHFTYDFTLDAETIYQQEIDVDFIMEGENVSRIMAGLSLKVFMFNIYADFNFGNYNSVRLGLMIGI